VTGPIIEDAIAERLSDAKGLIADGVEQLSDAIVNVVGLHHPSQELDDTVRCAECGQDRTGERLCNTLRALAVPLGVL
jgi:hypothetical protein